MATTSDRFVLTCWPCRVGRHGECAGTIILSTSDLTGAFPCACTAPGHPKQSQTERQEQ